VKECGVGVLLKGSYLGYLLWERFNAFLTCRKNSEGGICEEKVWGAAKMCYALLSLENVMKSSAIRERGVECCGERR